MDTITEVTRILADQSPLTRRQIIQRSGKSQAAVSTAVDLLASNGLVTVERAVQPSTGGRPSDLVAIRGAAADVVAIHVEPVSDDRYSLRCVSADLVGTIDPGSSKTLSENTFEGALAQIGPLLEEVAVCGRERTVVGVSVPGIVTDDGAGGSIDLYSQLGQRRYLTDDLRRLGWKATVQNSQDAAAIAELSHADLGVDSLLYVYWGYGLGSGIAKRSSRGYMRTPSAGEIGHIPVALDPATVSGRRCHCGAQGCLSAHAALGAVTAAAVEAGVVDASITPSNFLAGAAEHPGSFLYLQRAAQLVGRALSGVMNLTAPERVVIGGPIVAAIPDLGEVVRRTMISNALLPHRNTPVAIGGVTADTALRGIITDASRRFLSQLDRTAVEQMSPNTIT